MTSAKVKELVGRIMSAYELTPDMEDDLKKLIDSIDERERMEIQPDERDTKITELETALASSKQRYINRFLYGTDEIDETSSEEDGDESIPDTEGEAIEHVENMSIDDNEEDGEKTEYEDIFKLKEE